jgi:hypothetical protein
MTGKILTIALTGTLILGSVSVAFAQPTGPQPGSDWHYQGQRATRALNLLENRGDGQYSDFRASGADFTADVSKDGKLMPVLIRPDLQQIQPIGHTG